MSFSRSPKNLSRPSHPSNLGWHFLYPGIINKFQHHPIDLTDKIMTTEERLEIIEKRNIRVEAEKAWEVSLFRIASIMIVTYVIAYGAFTVIGNDNPFRNAFIPVIGYFLSTQSLPLLKKWWMEKCYKK